MKEKKAKEKKINKIDVEHNDIQNTGKSKYAADDALTQLVQQKQAASQQNQMQ